jgi:hypothetical protein
MDEINREADSLLAMQLDWNNSVIDISVRTFLYIADSPE